MLLNAYLPINCDNKSPQLADYRLGFFLKNTVFRTMMMMIMQSVHREKVLLKQVSSLFICPLKSGFTECYENGDRTITIKRFSCTDWFLDLEVLKQVCEKIEVFLFTNAMLHSYI